MAQDYSSLHERERLLVHESKQRNDVRNLHLDTLIKVISEFAYPGKYLNPSSRMSREQLAEIADDLSELRTVQSMQADLLPYVFVALGGLLLSIFMVVLKLIHAGDDSMVINTAFIWIYLTILVLGSVFCAAYVIFVRQLRDYLEDKLMHSDLHEKLADADPDLLSIHDYAPWIFNVVFLGTPRKTFRHIAKLVTNNLDWYLKPPMPIFRWLWGIAVGIILGFAASLLCAVHNLYLKATVPDTSMLDPLYGHYCMVMAFLFLMLLAAWAAAYDRQRRLFADYLLPYLTFHLDTPNKVID